MRKRVGVMALAAAGAMAFGGIAEAGNIGIAGTKLIVVNKGGPGVGKAVFVAKDALVDKGTGTDTTTIGVQLDITYDNGTENIYGQFLAAAGSPNWLVNKTTVGKYVNKVAPTGGGAKVVVIKPANLVKLVGKNNGDTNLDIFSASSAATGTAHTAFNITDSSTAFDETFCTTFAGCAWKSIAAGTGAKLVCKGGVADGTCAAANPPLTAVLSFVTGPAGGGCGSVLSGAAVRKTLGCGGLNIGGGNSTVAEGPTPGGAETQFNLTGDGTNWTVSARTAGETGSNNNCSDTACQFGPYLAIANSGTSTCVRNTFGSPASGSLDGSTGEFDGSVPLSSEVFLTANGTDPCPRCVAGTCQIGWTSGVGPSPTEGDPCTATDGAGSTYDCVPPAASALPSFPVLLTPISTGPESKSDAGGLFCPGQANSGAFGCSGGASGGTPAICPAGVAAPLIDGIEDNGSPAGALSAVPAAGTLASVFCIPSVGGGLGFLINGAANLPGPGATSLPGTLAIIP